MKMSVVGLLLWLWYTFCCFHDNGGGNVTRGVKRTRGSHHSHEPHLNKVSSLDHLERLTSHRLHHSLGEGL